MSDPVKNAEVEDVLSSIRRLVSEDKRPLSSPQKTPPIDRLVLTPDHRVAEDQSSDGSEQDQPDTAVSDPPEEALVQTADTRDAGPDPLTVKPEESSVDLGVDEFELVENTAKLSEDASDTLAPEDDYQDDPYGFADDEGDHETAGNTVPEIRFQHHAHREKAGKNDAPSELSAKIEALETAIGKISDNWEPDGTDSDDNAATPLPAMAWEDEETEDEPPEALTWPDDEPRDETADATVAQSAEEQRVALEDDMPAEATIAQRIEEQPLVVDDDMPAHQDEAVAPRSADPDDHIDLSPEDQLIDEDGLRDLISDIVREELQGALGERITRNVRKLVRREIHRALTARDLD